MHPSPSISMFFSTSVWQGPNRINISNNNKNKTSNLDRPVACQMVWNKLKQPEELPAIVCCHGGVVVMTSLADCVLHH